MPQKLEHVAPLTADNASTLHFNDAFKRRPEFAILFMEILTRWTYLESWLGKALARMLGARGDIGMEIFLSLEHNSAQLKVIRDVANLIYEESELSIFDAVLTLTRRAGRMRNKIAHGTWGAMDAIPDGLVLLPAKSFARWGARVTVRNLVDGFSPTPAEMRDLENKDALVYRKSEFQDTFDLIGVCLMGIYNLQELIAPDGYSLDKDSRDRLRRKLCDEPAIQEVLFRQSLDH